MNKTLEYVRNNIKQLEDVLNNNSFDSLDSIMVEEIKYDLLHFKIIEKELKAFEIIKKKKVDVQNLFYYFDLDKESGKNLALKHYNGFQKIIYKPMLTQEELKLLKEVLL